MMALDLSAKVLVVSIFALVCFAQWTSAQRPSGWKTLSGKAPLVIAHGGLSGLVPDQTQLAYKLAINNSLVDTVMFCDLQLTKDGQGICRTDIRLDNSTNIQDIFPNQSNSYVVNGNKVSGYFSIDFPAEQLVGINGSVAAKQIFSSRPYQFDILYPVLGPHGIAELQPSAIWLNVQYPSFFEEHNLSMSSYLLSLSRSLKVDYISSTEIGFLQAIAPRFTKTKTKTKIILGILGKEDIDPSINQTYGSFLNNLTFAKTFADGILVHKDYIWPTGTNLYLQSPTSLVQDAHSAGLEIFAANFANDEFDMSYNYSYDPVREYLQFVDNENFAVDGVLTDFPTTASEAIACYALNTINSSSNTGNPLIISHNGASGNYPGCTDTAYKAAIKDGADYIDCSVQITKDGVPFCRESPNLLIGTTITSNSLFYPSRISKIPGIGESDSGIFTFDLTWREIQSLTPNISSPFGKKQGLLRNPANNNVGKYLTLSSFLEFAKSQENVNALISIKYARTIASARNINIIEPTISALNMSGYKNMADRIMIKSDDNAVLRELKQRTKFKLVYEVDEALVRISDSTIKEIKEFTDTVTVKRSLVFSASDSFLSGRTDVVQLMHLHNMSVFISFLKNEFLSLAFDYLSDPTLEINSYVQLAKVDGLITDFPATAKAYLVNACRNRIQNEYSMFLVIPGELESIVLPQISPQPAQAPVPYLQFTDPPLPSTNKSTFSGLAPDQVFSPIHGGSDPSTACHSSQCLLLAPLIGLFVLPLNFN